MNKRDLPSILMFISSGVFLYLGLSDNNSTFTVLGVVFLVLAIVANRRRRTP